MSGVTAVLEGVRQFAPLPARITISTDAARVRARLEENVPELASGESRIKTCAPSLRLKQGDRWTASYELMVTRRNGNDGPMVLAGEFLPPLDGCQRPPTVRGAFGTSNWSADLPELGLTLRVQSADGALPVLHQLTDATNARALLQQGLRARQPDASIEACVPEIMRYKPGSRCTVRYRLDYASSGPLGPRTIVAKTYRGDKGANAYAGMVALGRANIPTHTVALAEPLAYLPALRVLLQGPVDEEETLKELIPRACSDGGREFARLGDAVAKTARGLAALHASGVEHGETVTWEQELAEVRELARRVAGPVPELAHAAAPLLQTLEALSLDHPADPSGPAHRSFRPAQVLLSRGGIAFIDFDGLCRAEPAIDVALFRATLRDVAMCALYTDGDAQRLLAMLDEVCDQFLDQYGAARPISLERVWLWESLDLLTCVLHCWTKIKPARLEPRVAMLEHHLRTTPLLR